MTFYFVSSIPILSSVFALETNIEMLSVCGFLAASKPDGPRPLRKSPGAGEVGMHRRPTTYQRDYIGAIAGILLSLLLE